MQEKPLGRAFIWFPSSLIWFNCFQNASRWRSSFSHSVQVLYFHSSFTSPIECTISFAVIRFDSLRFFLCVFVFLLVLAESREHGHSSPCLPNELLLSLFHSSLEHELSDREIPLASSDHSAFMHHILDRERDGHVAPFSLPIIKGQYKALHILHAQLLGSTFDLWSVHDSTAKLIDDKD